MGYFITPIFTILIIFNFLSKTNPPHLYTIVIRMLLSPYIATNYKGIYPTFGDLIESDKLKINASLTS